MAWQPHSTGNVQHHAPMVENEHQEQSLQLRKARQEIQELMQIHADALNHKAKTELKLRNAQAEISELNSKVSVLDGQIGAYCSAKTRETSLSIRTRNYYVKSA